MPGGVEIFEALLRKYSPDALSDTTILDLGCGTGSYPKELLNAGIKHAFLVDASQKMLEIAKQKMTRANFTNFETKVVNLPIGNLQYSTNFNNLEIFGYPLREKNGLTVTACRRYS